MRSHATQYTIRGVPADVDRVLRERARAAGKSFNQVALEALAAGAGKSLKPKRDLRDVIGSMSAKEADRIDVEISRQHQIDPELWR
jgi:hypothetical protein